MTCRGDVSLSVLSWKIAISHKVGLYLEMSSNKIRVLIDWCQLSASGGLAFHFWKLESQSSTNDLVPRIKDFNIA